MELRAIALCAVILALVSSVAYGADDGVVFVVDEITNNDDSCVGSYPVYLGVKNGDSFTDYVGQCTKDGAELSGVSVPLGATVKNIRCTNPKLPGYHTGTYTARVKWCTGSFEFTYGDPTLRIKSTEEKCAKEGEYCYLTSCCEGLKCAGTIVKTCEKDVGPNCLEMIPGHNDLTKNRINLVFVGVGFDDVNEFKSRALEVLDYDSKSKGLMSIEPINENKDKFNLFYVNEVLPDTGQGSEDNSITLLLSECHFAKKHGFAIGKKCLGFHSNELGRGYAQIGLYYPGVTDFNKEEAVHEVGHLIGALSDSSRPAVGNIVDNFCGGSLEDCRKNSEWADMIGSGCGKEGIVDCVKQYAPDLTGGNEDTMTCKSGGTDCYLEVDCYPIRDNCYRPEYITIMRYKDEPPFSYGPVGIRRFNRIFECCYPDDCDNFPSGECTALKEEDPEIFASCAKCFTSSSIDINEKGLVLEIYYLDSKGSEYKILPDGIDIELQSSNGADYAFFASPVGSEEITWEVDDTDGCASTFTVDGQGVCHILISEPCNFMLEADGVKSPEIRIN